MPIEEDWTEGRVASIGKSPETEKTERTVDYTVRSLVQKYVVIETTQEGQMGSVRHVAEFYEKSDAEEYLAWKRDKLPR